MGIHAAVMARGPEEHNYSMLEDERERISNINFSCICKANVSSYIYIEEVTGYLLSIRTGHDNVISLTFQGDAGFRLQL